MQAFTIAITTVIVIVVAIAIAARVEVTVVVAAAATKVATIELRSIKVIDCFPTMEPWK